jgi:hypothetical protein
MRLLGPSPTKRYSSPVSFSVNLLYIYLKYKLKAKR